jgi:hypothetical protein
MGAPAPPSDPTPPSADESRAPVTDLVARPRAVRAGDAALEGEVARLEGRNGRPKPPRPSGMAPATAAAARRASGMTHGDAGAAPRPAGR